jgi:hypothetical protein
LFGKKEFSQVFRVGEVVTSGAAPNRKNAAHLRILAIDDTFVRYQSLKSASKSRMRYSYLKLLLESYEDLDPKSIQKSVNRALKRAGFDADYSTENYAYSFAKAFHERTAEDIFLTQGEMPVTRSFQPEVPDYTEGRRVPVMVERIERDPKARLRCIQHYGAWCRVCRFDFEKSYGSIGKGFIHVHHHRAQLSTTRGKHKIHPLRDLIPLCPNCHAMAHSKKEMRSIEELQKIVSKRTKQRAVGTE